MCLKNLFVLEFNYQCQKLFSKSPAPWTVLFVGLLGFFLSFIFLRVGLASALWGHKVMSRPVGLRRLPTRVLGRNCFGKTGAPILSLALRP